jgi:methionyl-tRNA formyltransferase
MRVAFLGNARWSVPSVAALALSSHEVALVLTREARPAGRGSRLRRTAVAEAAGSLGLPLREVATVKSGPGFDALAAVGADALVVVAYGEILPQEVLDLPRVAPVNLHFSLLPELRGAAPVQRAILEGLAVTGVTTIRMDAGMDTGPILLQTEETIDPVDDAGSLGDRLAAVGGRLIVDTLGRIQAGTLEGRVQDAAAATFAPKLRPEDRVIDWSQPAEHVARQVRAMAPEPGATTSFRGRGLKVLRVRVGSQPEPLVDAFREGTGWPPGAIVAASKDGLAVMAGDWAIEPIEVAPEGRRRMSGAEFVRGYRPQVGETLG